jgi:hypothetical protein
VVKTVTIASSLVFAIAGGGCNVMQGGAAPILQTAPGDPVGSANIGTGSVTVNSMIPPEAKAAGMGTGP